MKISIERYRSTDILKKALGKKIVSSKSIIPIICIAGVIILGCLQIWQRVYVMDLVNEVSTHEKENRQIRDLLKKAEMRNIELAKRERIEKIAEEKLGMKRTDVGQIYTLQNYEYDSDQTGIDDVVSSLKKIADNLPVLNETKAETLEIFDLNE
ncbi:MAG: hypothetical protein ABIJ45_02030 [Candidatus Zixiibacteriota bacterium]